MTKYDIGDTIYIPFANHSQDKVVCPVCAGALKVLIKPFGAQDDAGQTAQCNYCSSGYDGPKGVVSDSWTWKGDVRTIKIEGIEERNVRGKISYKYIYNYTQGGYNFADTEDTAVFGNYEEAKIEADKLAEANTVEGQLKKAQINFDQLTWSVGYYKQQIKDGKKQIADARKTIKRYENQVKYSQKQLCIENET